MKNVCSQRFFRSQLILLQHTIWTDPLSVKYALFALQDALIWSRCRLTAFTSIADLGHQASYADTYQGDAGKYIPIDL